VSEVSVYNARAEFSRLIDRALAGEEIVITRNGEPVVRLVPCKQKIPRRRPGALKGLFEVTDAFFEPLPDEVLEAFYGGPLELEENGEKDPQASSER
jgi:prevent-host-death family protein